MSQFDQLVIAGGVRPFDQSRLGDGDRRSEIACGLGRMWLADLYVGRLGLIGRHQLPQAWHIECSRLVGFDDPEVLIERVWLVLGEEAVADRHKSD